MKFNNETIDLSLYSEVKYYAGEISYTEYKRRIKDLYYHQAIQKFRSLKKSAPKEVYDQFKKSLPAVCVAVNYKGNRRKSNFRRYNFVLVVDFDHLTDMQMGQMKELLVTLKWVDFFHVSPSGDGYKVFVALEYNGRKVTSLNYDDYAKLHKEAYNRIVSFFYSKTTIMADTSGKDLARICFVSSDADAWQNLNTIPFKAGRGDTNRSEKLRISENNKKESKKNLQMKKALEKVKKELEGKEEELMWPVAEEMMQQGLGIIDLLYYRLRKGGEQGNAPFIFSVGNRNNFLFRLACDCNRANVDQKSLSEWTARNFASLDTEERETSIASAYKKTEERGKRLLKNGERKILSIKSFLENCYELRFNEMSNVVEYRSKEEEIESDKIDEGIMTKTERLLHNRRKMKFHEVFKVADDRWISSLWVEMQERNVPISKSEVCKVLTSKFIPKINEVKAYIDNLPEWDGVDHLRMWAATVQTSSPDLFATTLLRWMGGMLMGVLEPETINHTMIFLVGKQGSGKTTFCNRILPPELRKYGAVTMLTNNSKDEMMMLAKYMVLIYDEQELSNDSDLTRMKQLITIPSLHFREPYGKVVKEYPHRSSFIGTTNTLRPIGEFASRRFICFNVEHINLDYVPNYPQLYSQVYACLANPEFKHWFEKEESERLMNYNDNFREQSMLEEAFMARVVIPSGTQEVRWLQASEITTILTYGYLRGNSKREKAEVIRLLNQLGAESKRVKNTEVYRIHVLPIHESEAIRNMLVANDSEDHSDAKTVKLNKPQSAVEQQELPF